MELSVRRRSPNSAGHDGSGDRVMEWLKLVVALVGVAMSIAGGGGVVTWYQAVKKARASDYQYLDATYSKLLDAYRARPQFGDPTRLAAYWTAFGEERLDYHFFAMTVHSFLETMFDVYE